MLTGQCLCGTVRYEIHAELGPVIYCHCSMCRRANGSAFATNASVWRRAFRVVAGEASIKEYNSSPQNYRGFCSNCGSPLYGRMGDYPQLLRVRLGGLDGDPGARSVAHIWVGSKSPWFDITDTLERCDERGPVETVLPGADDPTAS